MNYGSFCAKITLSLKWPFLSTEFELKSQIFTRCLGILGVWVDVFEILKFENFLETLVPFFKNKNILKSIKYFAILQDVQCMVQTLKSNVLRTLMGLDNKIS